MLRVCLIVANTDVKFLPLPLQARLQLRRQWKRHLSNRRLRQPTPLSGHGRSTTGHGGGNDTRDISFALAFLRRELGGWIQLAGINGSCGRRYWVWSGSVRGGFEHLLPVDVGGEDRRESGGVQECLFGYAIGQVLLHWELWEPPNLQTNTVFSPV